MSQHFSGSSPNRYRYAMCRRSAGRTSTKLGYKPRIRDCWPAKRGARHISNKGDQQPRRGRRRAAADPRPHTSPPMAHVLPPHRARPCRNGVPAFRPCRCPT